MRTSLHKIHGQIITNKTYVMPPERNNEFTLWNGYANERINSKTKIFGSSTIVDNTYMLQQSPNFSTLQAKSCWIICTSVEDHHGLVKIISLPSSDAQVSIRYNINGNVYANTGATQQHEGDYQTSSLAHGPKWLRLFVHKGKHTSTNPRQQIHKYTSSINKSIGL